MENINWLCEYSLPVTLLQLYVTILASLKRLEPNILDDIYNSAFSCCLVQ